MWLLVIAAGVFALVVRDTLIVSGDAAATAANILGAEQLFRLGFVSDLVSAGAYVGTTFLLYALLKPASRNGALFAALLGLAGSVIMAMNLAQSSRRACRTCKGGPALASLETGQIAGLGDAFAEGPRAGLQLSPSWSSRPTSSSSGGSS